MSAFLIQVSGQSIHEHADPAYVEGATGPLFCDEPLRHGEYFNASPFWRRDGFDRHDAWLSVDPGDEALLYCTSSVEGHEKSLSHLLPIEDVTLDDEEGARLTFGDIQELVPNIDRSEIVDEVEAGRFSERMKCCGQQGFNFTEIEESDVERVKEKVNLFDPL
jgi:hypothetical protein